MIYDCFSFFNELDILEIRLNTLNEVVDKFVLVEAPWIHKTGRPKPLYFEENKKRFAPFLEKIIHIVVSNEDLPSELKNADDVMSGWIRENIQRNCIAKGLTEALPDDILIIADLDEIPDPKIVKEIAQAPKGITNVNIRNFSYFLNYANLSTPIHYGGPQILTYATFLNLSTYANTKPKLECPACANKPPSATLIRFSPRDNTITGGWHFSSQGGVAAISKKIECIAEAHLIPKDYHNSPDNIYKRIMCGRSLDNNLVRFCAKPLEHNFPQFIKENKKRFAPLLLPVTEEEWQRKVLSRICYRCIYVFHSTIVGILISIIPKCIHPLFRKIRKKIGL